MASSPPSLDGTLGSVEIGLVLATFLYGIETLQTFNYYHDCTKDVVFLRTLVASIWFLELAHLICGCHAMYVMTVTFYGQSQHVLDAPISLVFTILFHAIITIVVQSYFAFRVGILLKRWHMTILCCLLSLLRLIGYLVLFVNLWNNPDLSLLTTEFNWIVISLSSIGPLVDVLIAASLVYFLWHFGGSKSTNNMVETIIIWTVETTMITSISGILQLILFVTWGDFSWMIFYLIQTKLFSNSMLASLNGRRHFRPVETTRVNTSSHLQFMNFSDNPNMELDSRRLVGDSVVQSTEFGHSHATSCRSGEGTICSTKRITETAEDDSATERVRSVEQ
ncbi:hypothetical protein C8R44DRAFT_812248 [Mycena epipterygia]|nr:hypothetical protein C8R44DRAFT_812248 [Mycena epipterygia]